MIKKVPQEVLPDKWRPDLISNLGFAPLKLSWQPYSGTNRDWDALIEMREGPQPPAIFGVEYKSDASPQSLAFSAMQIEARAQRDQILPLLVVPYLSEKRLLELETKNISAIDLCGNGIVRAPGLFYVFRTGYPNRFTSSRPIKNIYRGVSSLAVRAFLLKPRYAEIRDLQQEVERCGGDVSLPTLSKVLRVMEEELIVQRLPQADKPQARALRLLQPAKLLSCLQENYVPPKIDRSFVGKVAMEPGALRVALQKNAQAGDTCLIATGLGSAERYATVAMENTLYVYTRSLDTLLEGLPVTATNRFPNLSVQQTEDPTVYFDPRPDASEFPWSSPLTSYLELMQGEERLQQTATQIRETLLSAIEEGNT
jgi:hypothetical protein